MKFLNSGEGVSEVISYLFILGLTITGVAMIILVGVPSIFKLEDTANVRNAEQAFTVLDSRASNVFLGNSPMQIVDINLAGGTLKVEPNATGRESYMVIKAANNTFNMTLPMGKVKYQLGERTVAYEGGGIWSKYPSGGSVMLSPPEFHYNGKTLTLTGIKIIGNSTVGGKGSAKLSFKKNTTMVLFPNTSIDINRTNPLDFNINGKVFVNITSDYYDAWADFAKSLLYTKVSTDTKNRTTSIQLTVVPSTMGNANEITNPINMRGLPTDYPPLNEFNFTIYTAGMNKWDIRARNGNRTLIFYLDQSNQLSVGYQDSTYVTTPPGETWGPTAAYPTKYDADGKAYIDVNLLDKNTYLTYSGAPSPVGATNSLTCKPGGFKVDGTNYTDYSWDDLVITTTNTNRTQSLYNITEHYIWKMVQLGDLSLGECAPSDKFPADGSTLTLNYSTTGGITFLHVSSSTADVDVD